ncbi:MAG: FG-GAP-like repeat-containing protein [Polyangiales bacterium]
MRPTLALAALAALAGCGAPTPSPAPDVPDVPAPTDAPRDRADDLAPTPDATPTPDAGAPDASGDVALPPPRCTALAVVPASVRMATGRGLLLRATGGSERGALFALAPGAETGGATVSVGGSLLAGPRAARFEVVASDLMCDASARASVEVVGPFALEPSDVRIAPGRTLRFNASGALGAVRWEVLQRPDRGDAALDATGVFTSGTVAGAYRLRATDVDSGSELQATVTVAAGATFAPASEVVLVPRGRRVRLDWRGGSRFVTASIGGGSAGGTIAGTAGEVIFDATSARAGSATVNATDRYTNERATVRVVVGEELAPTPVARGAATFAGDVATGDLNRDGRADVVLGHGNRSENGNETGGVLVYFGQAGGGFRARPDQVIDGLRDNDLFGANVYVTDLDGDRRDDLLVASPNQDLGRDGRGSVQVFLGSPDGVVTPAERTFVGEVNGDSFGTSLALEDLDGDGARDLVVAAPNASSPFNAACGRAGRVYVFRATPGLRGVFQLLPAQILEVRDRLDDTDGPPQCRTGSGAGAGLALLDMDGDGARDLVLGAPGSGAPNFGSVIIHRGTTRGTFEDAPAWVIHVATAQRTNNPRLGFGLEVVPCGASNRCLAVRVPTYGINAAGASANNAGGFFVFRPGTLGAPMAGTVRVLTTAIATNRFAGAAANDAVGRSGAVGDVDGDGDADYLVGAGDRTDGAVLAFDGASLAGTAPLTPLATLRGEMGSQETLGHRIAFGQAPAGMAAPLLVVSAYRSTATVFGGAARWIPAGPPAPLADRWAASAWLDFPVLPAFDRSGTAVALGALRGTSAGDLVVGSPGAHSSFVPPAGTAPSRPAGFRARTGAVDLVRAAETATADRWWVDRANAALGSAVAVLDFDGDGRLDLAVGDPGESSGGTDMIARASPPLANTATDPCWYRSGATAAVATVSLGGRGLVRVYLQGTDGVLRERFWAIPRETVLPTGTPSGATNIVTARRGGFGFSLAPAGDVNGDGLGDLLVGRAGGTNNGAEVVLGQRPDVMGRITAVCADPAAAPYWPSRTDGVNLGVAVAGVGDLDDDGCAETAISLSGGGRAGLSIEYGFGARCRRNHLTPHELVVVPDDRPLRANDVAPGDPPRPVAQRNNDWVDLPGANTGMGLVLAGGVDLTGDRVPDVAVRDAALLWRDVTGPAVEILSGAWLNGLCPEHVCAAGLDGRFYSDGAGYNVVGVRTLAAPDRVIVPPRSATAQRFGASLAAADVNGDGVGDLVVGAADDSTWGDFAGAVMVWRASSDPMAFAGDPWLVAVGDTAEPSLFGASVAVSRDAGGAWVAVGAPFSNHRGAETGAAYRWRIDR